jgi:hypothetical protein
MSLQTMMSPHWRYTCFATVALLAAVIAASHAHAASIWETAGPFQLCLEGRLEKWVNARAELVVNQDPKAGSIGDADVAQWSVETIDACRVQAGGGDQESEARFTKHMARWRDHIYDLVRSIQKRAGPD